ncbi:hypothetical protein [Aurantibacter aestuarii]|nr:hypothetical protein [Aurantibacter aestuarii]
MKTIFAALLVSAAFTSCIDDDQEYTFSDKPEVTIVGQTLNTIEEGQTTTVNLRLAYGLREDVNYKLELISGGTNDDYFVSDADGNDVGATTAEDGLGLEGYEITIPATQTEVAFNITATKDLFDEDTETLVFKLRSTGSGLGSIGVNDTFEVEVTNFTSDNFGLILDWESDITYEVLRQNVLGTTADDETLEVEGHGCDLADFDVYLTSFDAYAFTGNCPEFLIETVDPNSLATSVLADGTYTVEVDFWDFFPSLSATNNDVLVTDFTFPMTLTLAKVGQFNAVLDLSSEYSAFDGSSNNGGNGVRSVATIEVVNGKYTVYNASGELVAAE